MYRVLQTVMSDEEQYGRQAAQQAQQQQSLVQELQAGLLRGNLFRQFLSQHCGPNSSVTQICGHQAFAQAMSSMIRQAHHVLMFLHPMTYLL